MIKTFLIAVLTLALLVAAFLTRPSERTARAFLANDPSVLLPEGPKPLNLVLKDALLKSAETGQKGVPEGYVFKDRGLWVEVQDAQGRSIYTGVLAHWFKHEPATAAEPTAPKPAEAPLAVAQPASRGR